MHLLTCIFMPRLLPSPSPFPLQFMVHRAASKPGTLTHYQRYGPSYLLALAIPLMLADQVRHALQDSGVWPEPGSSMFRDDCDDTTGLHGFTCLTTVGWIFSIGCTYTGACPRDSSLLTHPAVSSTSLTCLHFPPPFFQQVLAS